MKGEVFMSKRHSLEEVRDFIEKQGYSLVSTEYINAKAPIIVKCDKGHEYSVRFTNFKSGKRCPECAIIKRNESKRLDKQYVKQIVEEAGYTLIDIIEGVKSKPKALIVRCDKGHEPYKVNYQNFRKGRRCPECKAEKMRVDLSIIKENMRKEGFEFIKGEYKSNRSPIIVRCPKGHEYSTTYGLFKEGKRCSKCRTSKGEIAIKSLLEEILIDCKMTQQYPVKINNTTYHFDFCVHANKKLFIEYDGIQHFVPIEAFGGVDGFNKQKVNDKIKDDYVKNNKDTELLRVPYYYNKQRIYESVINFLANNGVSLRV